MKKSKLMTFPIAIICTIIYFILGFFFNLWHPGWLIFLIIPLYYGIVNFITKDK